MLAYLNDPTIKTNIMAQLAAYREADQIVKGVYWENGKGCAVGCTIHSGNHIEYEKRFGIPIILARLEDRIFEGLANGTAMEWPERFMGAIKPGADLTKVWPKFAAWLLADPTDGVIRFAKTPAARAAIQKVADLYAAGETNRKVWKQAWVEAAKQRRAAAAAYAAYAAYAAADAARAAAYRKQADKLIELLEAA